MTGEMTGGCACRRVRFRVRIENGEAYLCHCRMCQRATGGVSVAFKNVKRDALAWEREPDWYVSSPIARRPYCRECGTPRGFEYPDSDNLDLTVGAFDDPSRFEPKFHFGVETMHRAWLDTEGLPEYRIEDNSRTVERWMKAVGKLPE